MYTLEEFKNGFKYLQVKNKVASAKIALQGAHIFEFKYQNKNDILWLSPVSDFKYGSAIRGGIPICWPRFGTQDMTLPAHGFSRTAIFECKKVLEIDAETTQIVLSLKDSEKSRKIWNHVFELEVIFTISSTLKVEILTRNKDLKEFMITEALHTYLSVSHINDVTIEGLQNKPYLDTLTNKFSSDAVVLCINSECDRVYQEIDKEIVLKDHNHKVVLHSKGSLSAVVWNPWIEKGSQMSGMNKDAYKEFVCIETTNAFDDFVIIQPNELHRLQVTLLSSP